MKKIILPIVTVAFLILSCNDATTEINSLDAKHFSAVVDSLQNEQLIDVRTTEEFNHEHINGAVNIDWNGTDFASASSKLDKSKPVMVYCLSGSRSADAADWMKKNGFVSVYQLDHGMLGWKADGLPIATTTVTAPKEEITSEVTVAAYQTLITTKTVVLVDFSATWCGPCKMLAPRLEELVQEKGEQFKLIKLDADRDADLANSMDIKYLPTLLLYKNGKLIWRNEGLVDKSVVADQIAAAQR